MLIIHAQEAVVKKEAKLPPKITRVDVESLPQETRNRGKVLDAARWTDDDGEHTLVTTETGEITGADDTKSAGIFAFHYLLKQNRQELTWKLNDAVKDCPVDVEAGYVHNTFAVTDLDKNGKAEVWLMYITACHGDVSPANMKIIMYESGKKHAARGTNKVQVSEKEFAGGEYNFDEIFKKSPKVFRQYADKLWQKNILQK
ncbi:hypothetical protein EGI32_05475 [Ferruginibacter sp. HRS2-29]|nr:hypothetical protein [Ferruginibacter sp. HRS2-29]